MAATQQKRVSMRPLKLAEIPFHPSLPTDKIDKSKCPDLQQFVQEILDEAHAFLTNESIWQDVGEKSALPAKAPVHITKHARTTPGTSTEETWFQRTSIHENKSEPGTATFEEFDNGLRANHSKNEEYYTPGIVGVYEIVNYASLLQELGGKAGRWYDVDLYLMQMKHKVPAPLKKRVFTVLVAAGKASDQEFMDAQIPVELFDQLEIKKNATDIVHGVYASAERGSLDEGASKVKWEMATASDAKGILPMFIQKLAMPGEVAKDVGRFIEWRQNLRKAES